MNNNKKEKTCCFTGHRAIPPRDVPIIKEKLKKTLIHYINQGYLYFGAGGALGFDTLAAQTVLELREDFPEIKLILVLPHKNQTYRWKNNDVIEYERIMEKADKAVYVSEKYFSGCFHKRNRHLADESSLCICYLTENHGGTAYTVNYAKEKGLKIVNLAETE